MNRIAVVTGAGSGVGQAIVLKLAEAGFDVALIGRTERALEETVNQAARFKRRLLSIPCDVSDESQVQATAQRVQNELGTASVLVNSAGVNVPKRKLADLAVEDYQKIIAINLTGAFLCTHAFLPAMRAAGSGTIVQIISDAGLIANGVAGAAYISAKFGLVGLSDAINIEERKNGIRSCAICPGAINTPLLDKRPVPPSAEARKAMLQAEDVADCVMLAINLPPRAIVERLLLMPR
jgi:NAD(P)-dependent dehydrogenase (short-subunit alcohol dehydrogenase family)